MLRRELLQVVGVVARRWRAAGWRGFAVVVAVSAGVIVTSVADHGGAGSRLVTACCGERADLPRWIALVRLPGSMIAPSPLLPAWGSIAQVVVVFAIAESAVGRSWALAVAATGHAIATWSTRVVLALPPGSLLAHAIGLPMSYRSALDTGPSAATVALGVYLAVVLRTPVLGAAFSALIALAYVVHPDLAGREHMVALAVGVLGGLWHLWLLGRRAHRAAALLDFPAVTTAAR